MSEPTVPNWPEIYKTMEWGAVEEWDHGDGPFLQCVGALPDGRDLIVAWGLDGSGFFALAGDGARWATVPPQAVEKILDYRAHLTQSSEPTVGPLTPEAKAFAAGASHGFQTSPDQDTDWEAEAARRYPAPSPAVVPEVKP